MKVVAEGVESEESLATVTEMGVDLVQGFLLHRPCAPEDFPSAHLLEHRAG